MIWLEHRRAWDDRLVELERGRGALEADRRETGRRVRFAGREGAGT